MAKGHEISSGDTLDCQLCIPQDPIEELDWYPNFAGDLITLNDLCFPLEHETHSPFHNFNASSLSPADFPITPEKRVEKTEENRTSTMDLEYLTVSSSLNKKQRSNREWMKRKGAPWKLDFVSEKASSAVSELLKNVRRCSHCETDKTPQWRVGPLGPKSLCNACGVRYKSGRLVPEYRPASSPSFNGTHHSNFHKQILKMKEMRK